MRTLLIGCMLCLGLVSHAQVIDNAPFCPPGATWIGYQMTFGSNNNAIYSFEKDTSIAGFACKKINVFEVVVRGNFPNGQYTRGVYPYPPQFWRYSNDSLTAWNGSRFEFWGAYDSTLGKTYGVENSKVSCGIAGVSDASMDSFFLLRKKDYVNNGVTYLGCEYRSLKNSFQDATFLRNIGYRNCPYPAPNFNKCSGSLIGMPNDVTGIVYLDNIRGMINYTQGADTSFVHFLLTDVKNLNGQSSSQPSISIYPNPASDQVALSGFEYLVTAQFIDLQGRTVASRSITSAQLPIDFLQTGVYVVRFIGKDGTSYTVRLVKR